MSWLLLALSLAAFCVAWSVHSPLLMAVGLVVALAALAGFAWVRYKLLFPERTVAIEDTPMTAEDVRRMRDAQLGANVAVSAPALPAASQPDPEQMRAAALRVAEREAMLQQQAEAQRQLAELEQRAADAETRARDMEQRLADLQRETPKVAAIPAASPEVTPPLPVANTGATAAALPKPVPQPQPSLREEGWNPYAGEVHAPPKRPFDAKAAGLDVPMLTPLRDEPDPT